MKWLPFNTRLLFTFACRFNKLALNDDTVIDEMDHLVPVQVQPLANLCIKDVAFGVSHSAFLTGTQCSRIEEKIPSDHSLVCLETWSSNQGNLIDKSFVFHSIGPGLMVIFPFASANLCYVPLVPLCPQLLSNCCKFVPSCCKFVLCPTSPTMSPVAV